MLVARSMREVHEAPFDPHTVTHFAGGLALGINRAPLAPTLALAVAWEVFERAFAPTELGRRFFPYGPESRANVATDVAVYLGAWWLGRRFAERS